MGLKRKKVSGRSRDVLVDEDTHRYVKWVPPKRENPSSPGVETFRAHNPAPADLVTLENPSHSSTPTQTAMKQMDEATKQFTNVLQTAGAVTGGTVIAKRVVNRAADRLADQVGLTGPMSRRLTRIGALAAVSTIAMMNDREIVKSIGVGHGVVVVEEGIDLVTGLVDSTGTNGNGGENGSDVSGARALLGPGLGSGFSSEGAYQPAPAVQTQSPAGAGRDFAPGS